MNQIKSFLDNCPDDLQPQLVVVVEDRFLLRRTAFRNANASLALSGMIVDEYQLALQEEIIQGGLSSEQAISRLSAAFKETKLPRERPLAPLL
jgi:hypothetical protein